jgi:hypothetical protein
LAVDLLSPLAFSNPVLAPNLGLNSFFGKYYWQQVVVEVQPDCVWEQQEFCSLSSFLDARW